jgi:hypothetical protein
MQPTCERLPIKIVSKLNCKHMKILISIIIGLTSLQSLGQVQPKQNVGSTTQINSLVTYRLFPTQNMWTFLKLNTRNGEIWQVQFDMKGDNRLVVDLNFIPLVAKEDEVNDRFTLYPTQNIYTFILLDQFSGKIWQVQWSTQATSRIIVPIE